MSPLFIHPIIFNIFSLQLLLKYKLSINVSNKAFILNASSFVRHLPINLNPITVVKEKSLIKKDTYINLVLNYTIFNNPIIQKLKCF